MESSKKCRIVQTLMLSTMLLFLSTTISLGAVVFDVDAIDSEITAAIASGKNPVLAAKGAVANSVRAIVAKNPSYPGGQQALNAAIFDALAKIQITGLDDTDLFVAANHALGNSTDSALEAYEKPDSQGIDRGPIGGDKPMFNPSGPPSSASPT